MTTPAAETKSIGLLAIRAVVMVFALHLDNFIMTGQLLPSIGTQSSGQLYRDAEILPTYRDFAKTLPTLTQTATPHTTGPLAKIRRPPGHEASHTTRNSTLP